MANIEKLKEQARKFEAKEQWAKAVEPLVKAIEEFESTPDASDADLALYNRVGDLYIKLGDTANAVAYYDRAVDKYAEGGLVNNAIALCNKVLRLSPGRTHAYLKLGMLFHKKGFDAEAKQNLLEYAGRMQKAGQLEEAFKALKKFAEMSPGSDEIWGLLAQQARAQAKTPEAAEQVEKLLGEFEAKDRVATQRKSRMSRSMITGEVIKEEPAPKKGELIFLDVGDISPPPRKSGPSAAPKVEAPAPPRRSAATAAPAVEAPPRKSAATRPSAAAPPPPPEPEIPPLEIEPTSLAVEEPPSPVADLPLLEVEPEPAAEAPALELEPTSLAEAAPAEPMAGLEPTMLDFEPTAVVEPPAAVEPPEAIGLEPPPAVEPELMIEPVVEAEPEPVAEAEPVPVAEAVPEPEAGLLDLEVELPEAEAPPVEVAPAEEAPVEAAPAEPTEGLPMLETAAQEPAFEVVHEEPQPQALEFMDLGEVTVTAPSAEDLEARVAANPQDWEAHRHLGEALLEKGERERGLAELENALDGYDQADDLEQAYAVVEEILRLEPNSVRHHQKRVELAYRQSDRARLVDAYVELADALLRSDEPDKAIAVYQRVLEHDPANLRAQTAIETLAPPPTAAPAAPAAPARAVPAPSAERPAAAVPAGEYVDLGAMLLDEEMAPKDTRMRIEDEEPTGDEQKDFQQMLAAFKKGIEANVEETDFQSHYDLGVAYKEMGLLDEAIAEFQKALRATEGRLKSSEALGLCFFEKGQFAVAETILRRALDLPAANDAERLGILYWLGRTQEEQDKGGEALVSYNRVFAVDIGFQDVNQRVQALAKAKAR